MGGRRPAPTDCCKNGSGHMRRDELAAADDTSGEYSDLIQQ